MATSYKQKDTGAQQLSASSAEKTETRGSDDYINKSDFLEIINLNNQATSAMFVQAIRELYDIENKRNANLANTIYEPSNQFPAERSKAQQRFKNSYPRIR
ncbi:MAG: hypothetical protein ABI723_27250 [Bacteroidia bacterium]